MGSISVIFHTNDYYAYVGARLTDNSNTSWVRILRVPFSFCMRFNTHTLFTARIAKQYDELFMPDIAAKF